MKQFLSILLLTLFASAVVAQPAKGRRLVTGSGTIGFGNTESSNSDNDYRQFNAGIGYGWFTNDRWLFTPSFFGSIYQTKFKNTSSDGGTLESSTTTMGIGANLSYFHATKSDKLYLVYGGGISYGISKSSSEQPKGSQTQELERNGNDYGLNLRVGLAYFLNERWFLETTLVRLNASYTNERASGETTTSTNVNVFSALNNFGLGISYFLR